jgi:septum site-determining protein MinC
MAKTRSALEIKGRMLSLTRVRILETDADAIEAQLRAFTRTLGEAAAGLPVLLEADVVTALEPILERIRGAGLQPLAVLEGPLAAAARKLGLPVLAADALAAESGASTVNHRSAPVAQAPDPAPEAAVPTPVRKPTRVITEPIRSGQQIYAENADLAVMSTVSAGAEVIADGCVHVYGALRGRAIAGARGDTQARVFCRRMEAELLAVAGIYAVAEQVKGALRGLSVQAYLADGTLRIEKLEG